MLYIHHIFKIKLKLFEIEINSINFNSSGENVNSNLKYYFLNFKAENVSNVEKKWDFFNGDQNFYLLNSNKINIFQILILFKLALLKDHNLENLNHII